jgi:hypothetical protein
MRLLDFSVIRSQQRVPVYGIASQGPEISSTSRRATSQGNLTVALICFMQVLRVHAVTLPVWAGDTPKERVALLIKRVRKYLSNQTLVSYTMLKWSVIHPSKDSTRLKLVRMVSCVSDQHLLKLSLSDVFRNQRLLCGPVKRNSVTSTGENRIKSSLIENEVYIPTVLRLSFLYYIDMVSCMCYIEMVSFSSEQGYIRAE